MSKSLLVNSLKNNAQFNRLSVQDLSINNSITTTLNNYTKDDAELVLITLNIQLANVFENRIEFYTKFLKLTEWSNRTLNSDIKYNYNRNHYDLLALDVLKNTYDKNIMGKYNSLDNPPNILLTIDNRDYYEILTNIQVSADNNFVTLLFDNQSNEVDLQPMKNVPVKIIIDNYPPSRTFPVFPKRVTNERLQEYYYIYKLLKPDRYFAIIDDVHQHFNLIDYIIYVEINLDQITSEDTGIRLILLRDNSEILTAIDSPETLDDNRKIKLNYINTRQISMGIATRLITRFIATNSTNVKKLFDNFFAGGLFLNEINADERLNDRLAYRFEKETSDNNLMIRINNFEYISNLLNYIPSNPGDDKYSLYGLDHGTRLCIINLNNGNYNIITFISRSNCNDIFTVTVNESELNMRINIIVSYDKSGGLTTQLGSPIDQDIILKHTIIIAGGKYETFPNFNSFFVQINELLSEEGFNTLKLGIPYNKNTIFLEIPKNKLVPE